MDKSEIRDLLHRLRDPLGALAIRLDLLEREPLSPTAQSNLEAMQIEMQRARDTFDEVDFILQNGHERTRTNRESAPQVSGRHSSSTTPALEARSRLEISN